MSTPCNRKTLVAGLGELAKRVIGVLFIVVVVFLFVALAVLVGCQCDVMLHMLFSSSAQPLYHYLAHTMFEGYEWPLAITVIAVEGGLVLWLLGSAVCSLGAAKIAEEEARAGKTAEPEPKLFDSGNAKIDELLELVYLLGRNKKPVPPDLKETIQNVVSRLP